MNNTLKIVLKDDLQQIFTSVSEAFNMRMSVMDINMKALQFQPICSYCHAVQNTLGLLQLCQENDKKYCSMAQSKKKAVSYTCHAGLREAVFPIFIENEAIGFFIVGQFSSSSTIPLSIRRKIKSEEDQNEINNAFNLITSYEEHRLNSILKLIEITTEYVIDKKIISIKRNLLSDKVYDYIIQSIDKNPTAEETAAAMNMSTSSINKALKQVHGSSFRQFSNKIRLDKAKQLLEENCNMSIMDVSFKVGIQDSLYFSRIFKREYGFSPKFLKRNN